MTIIKKTLAAISLTCLFSLPAHAGGYHNHSGISINIGSHHSGISLNYHAPKQYKHVKKSYKHHGSHHATNLNYRISKPYKHIKKSYKAKASHYKPYKIKIYPHYQYVKQYKKPYKSNKHHVKYLPKQYQPVKIISRSCHPITQRVLNRYGRYETIVTQQCYDRLGHAYSRHH